MIITDIKRVIRAGFVNFWRSGIVSWASVLVVTITLSVITSIILLQAVLYNSLDQIQDKVDITIYFHTNADEAKIDTLKNSIEKLPEVASTNFVTKEEALRIFRERHENDYPTIQALDEIGVNPLGSYLNIKAKEVSQYESIANFLKGDNALVTGSASIVDKINYFQNKIVIERLNNIIDGAERLGFLVTLILVIISIIITFNTVRLTIFIAKEEIAVMRLVGASKMMIRGPFMVEGVIYGAIATLFTLLLFWPVTAYLGRNLGNFLGLNVYSYYTSNILSIAVIVLLSGVLLGVISSVFAIRRYLNK